jgi:hypothetical protein
MTNPTAPAFLISADADGIAFRVGAEFPEQVDRFADSPVRRWNFERGIVLADSEHDAESAFLAEHPEARVLYVDHPEA